MDVEVSIPRTSIEQTGGPFTVYHILVRLPLRSYEIHKRYSDFVSLVAMMEDEVKESLPVKIPGKSLFKRTVNNPELTEQRRQGLEEFLQTILSDSTNKWRSCTCFREFLQLPPGFFSSTNQTGVGYQKSDTALKAQGIWSLTGSRNSSLIKDPTVWMDTIRECKSLLVDARAKLSTSNPDSRRSLILVGNKIPALEKGLAEISSGELGTGELLRRKDLLVALKNEYTELDNLLRSISSESSNFQPSQPVRGNRATIPSSLLSKPDSSANSLFSSPAPVSSRVLGPPKETDRTRKLDNQQLLEMEKSDLVNQDEEINKLRAMIQKQKQIGYTINEELSLQSEMLDDLDQSVNTTAAKLKHARRRADKIL